MWNDTQTNGAGTHGGHGGYDGYGEASYGQAATSPHPSQVLENFGPSRVLFDDGTPEVTDLDGALPTADVTELIRLRLLARSSVAGFFDIRRQGRLVVPRDLASRRAAVPVVFIVMGNHQATETRGGVAVLVESFKGYDYLQQSLADLGVASCSVDTNFANALNLGIRARAEILVDTIAMIRAVAPAATLAKLDFARVGFVGHSRGGDAVVMAQLLGVARSEPFTVPCVVSIAPTDFTGGAGGSMSSAVRPAPAAPLPAATPAIPLPIALAGGTRYLVLLGAHDGDVAGPSGNGFGHYDRARVDKTLIFARGLTHNRFNTVWNECADYADGRNIFVQDDDCRVRGPQTFDPRIFAAVVHREYAKFFVGAIVRRTLLGDASAEDTLRGLVAPTRAQLQQSPGLAGPAASVQWSVTSALTIDEFDAAGLGARGPAAITVEPARAGRPRVPHATRAFVATAVGQSVRIECGGSDQRARRELSFRLTSMIPVTSEATIQAARSPDWEVRLITGRGTSRCQPTHLDQRGLRAPNKPFFCEVYPIPTPVSPRVPGPATLPPINVTKNQYDTLTLPLSSFSGADLSNVIAVEIEARGGELPLIVDSIAFV